MKDKLNVAVIGAGLFGQVHLYAYKLHPKAHLKLVCDVNEARLKKVKEDFDVEVTADYKEALKDETIDAVSVVTPDFMHREIVTAALKAGKHVLVEKPLATDTGEAREMVKAAKSARKQLMVDFQNRWNPPIVEAKRRIAAGDFGIPVIAHARLANTLSVPREMLSWSGRSGPHWFLYPHIIDMICWLFERQAVRVTAIGRKGVLQSMGIDTYDAIQALVEFTDCSATFETAWILPDSFPHVVDFTATLLGTKSRIALNPLGPLMDVSGEKRFEWPIVGATQEIHGKVEGWQLMPITHFVDSLLNDRRPMCTPEEGFHNTAIICAVEESIETGKTVAVENL